MKKAKLYYTFKDNKMGANSKEYIGLYLKPGGTSSSCWFKNLPINISKALFGKYIPSPIKFYSFLKRLMHSKGDEFAGSFIEGGATISTARTCPGIADILKTSMLVTAPTDIHITVFSDCTCINNTGDDKLATVTLDHHMSQFTPLDQTSCDIFNNKIAVKIRLPLLLGTNKGKIPYLLLGPQYHSSLPAEFVMGAMRGYNAISMPLNLIYLMDVPTKGDATWSISKGEVLGYVWAPEPLELEEKKIQGIHRQFSFLGGHHVSLEESSNG